MISNLLSLTHDIGGPAFLASLHNALVLQAILSNLCPSNNPSLLVLASLQTLSNLADSAALALHASALKTSTLAEGLFSRQHLGSLCRILSQTSTSSTVQCQISISAALISRICREERHQQSLASSGVLDALATKLASFVVAEGLAIPGSEIFAQRDGLQEFFPLRASPNARLDVILEAISVIIADSKLRASQLLYSPSILAVLPATQSTEFVANQNTRAAWNAFNSAGLSARQSQLNAADFLLPCMPLHQPKSGTAQASAFPPLGTSGSRESLIHNGRKQNGTSLPSWTDAVTPDSGAPIIENSAADSEEPESPLVAYLIYLLRAHSGIDRLMAASVLTVLYRAGLTHKSRETAIGLLVVPLLVYMLDEDFYPSKVKDALADAESTASDWTIKEKAPAVIAMLITDSEYLQKAAFDANAVGKLSKMLKISYDPVPESSELQPWSPQNAEGDEDMEASHTFQLGHQGQSPFLVHKINVRESTLKAIAALVPFKDEYRKAMVDEGVIPYIVESMFQIPCKPIPRVGEKSEKAVNRSSEEDVKQRYGFNTVNVLIAACGTVRALSRSVSVLRTSLVDNGIAHPIFSLLKHPDIEVQIAATATVCNLVTDVSPMRDVSMKDHSKNRD